MAQMWPQPVASPPGNAAVETMLNRWMDPGTLYRFRCTDGCKVNQGTRECEHGYPIWLVWWGLVT